MYKKLALLALLASTAVYAEDIQSTKLNESVISTENFETNVRETAANITVVTAEDMEKSGATTLVDALKNVPGISVKRYYSGEIKFDIRGLNSMYSDRNSLITLDGVPVSSIQVSDMPIDSIERIEVVPGGGGILYGDKAIGGIVNIITKSAPNKKNYGNVFTGIGSESERKFGINYGTKLTDRLITEFGYTGYTSNGYRDDEDFDKKEGRFKTKYLLDNGEVEFKYTHNDNKKVRGNAIPKYEWEADRDYPGTLTRAKNKSNDYYLKWRQNITKDTEFLIYGNLYENKKWSYKSDRGYYRNEDETRKYVKAQIKHNYLPDSYFIVGVDTLEEKVKPYTSTKSIIKVTGKDDTGKSDITKNKYVETGDSVKTGYGIFALNKYTIGKLQLTQGIRYDYAEYDFYWRNGKLNNWNKIGTNDTTDYDNYSFELTANYLYSDTGSAYISYNRAFRTPVASEIYYTRNSEKLDPQTQDTIELGVKDFIANTYLSASTFYKYTTDEIYSTIPPEFTGMVNYNIGNTERIGAELYAEHYIGDLTLKSSVTYIKNNIVTGNYAGNKIPSIPEWKLTFGAGYNLNSNLSVGADAIYSGNSYDLDDIGNEREGDTGEYVTVDIYTNWKFDNGLSITFRLNNVFDEVYHNYAGYWEDKYDVLQRQYYPAPGRTYSVSVNYKF